LVVDAIPLETPGRSIEDHWPGGSNGTIRLPAPRSERVHYQIGGLPASDPRGIVRGPAATHGGKHVHLITIDPVPS